MILGASAIASDWPSRDLTVRFWPSSFSTVPRTRTGAGAGGVWASAGTTNRLMIATAIAVLRMVDPPLSVLLHQVTQKWRGTLVFSAHILVSVEWRPARETRRRGLTSVRPQPAAVDRSLDGFRLRFEILRPLPKLLPGQLAPLAADVALHDHLE